VSCGFYAELPSRKFVNDVLAFRTLLLSVPVITILFNMCWVAGMAIFATYADCDPLTMGYTSKIDEIVPFFVEDKFNYLPGMLGIFMASLFNGSFK